SRLPTAHLRLIRDLVDRLQVAAGSRWDEALETAEGAHPVNSDAVESALHLRNGDHAGIVMTQWSSVCHRSSAQLAVSNGPRIPLSGVPHTSGPHRPRRWFSSS